MNGALAACITGMGTKEIMVTVPVLVLLYDAWAGAGSWREAVHQRWKVHLALFLSVGVFVMLFVMFSAATMATGGLVEKGINPWSYALTQTEVILHYFRLCVLPTSLCLMYRWPFAQSLAEVWPAALALAAVLGLTVWGLVRRAAFAFPLAAVFVILAPTSSIMPLSDAAFEHRMYLPLAGVLALLTVGAYALVDRTVRRWPEQTTRLPVLSLLLALTAAAWFLSLTRSRNLDYRSEGAIWEDVMKKRPDNHKVRVAMSGALMGSGRLEEAADVLTNLIARLPDFSKMPFDEIRRRYEANPTLPVIEYAMAQNNLGALYLLLSQPDTAEPRFREAIRVFPANHIGYFNMGRIAIGRGQTNDAIGWWKIALLKNKDDVGSMCFLATARAAMDRYADAAAYYDRALRVQPENPFARSQLAWILATCPEPAVRNGPRAVQLARILPGLSGDASVRAYDILGAALAEAGQFDEAVSQAEKALALRRSQLPASAAADPYADEVSRRLSLYRRHQPYREPHPASP
jgi:tetratricopeptide (TPR) repeat protein